MDESLNRDLYEQIVRGIATARKKKRGRRAPAHRRGAVSARGRAARGLVDDVAYEDQVDDKLRAAASGDDATVDGDDYARVSRRRSA